MAANGNAATEAGEQLLPGRLARRAAGALAPRSPYLSAVINASHRLWSPEDPDGNCVMSVAENRMTTPLLAERMGEAAAALQPVPVQALYYDVMAGTAELRGALARLAGATLLQGSVPAAGDIVALAGAGAVLDALFHCLGDAGDAVLIPAPYYPAFDNDLTMRDGLVPTPVHLDRGAPLGPQLDAAAAACAAAGRRVAALLVTNPDNPTGTLYSRAALAEMLDWCLAHSVHVVSDEVYASSIFEPADFVSMARLAQQRSSGSAPPHQQPTGSQAGGQLDGPSEPGPAGTAGAAVAVGASANGPAALHGDGVPACSGADPVANLVHVVFGFSKDFCASGLRVGCLYTRNQALLQALGTLAYFGAVGGPSQAVLAEVLRDGQWVQHFLHTNKLNLLAAYRQVTGGLKEAGVPFLPAVGGMFVWLDLSRWLPEPTWQAEDALWQRLVQAGLVLTPGKDCHAREPGCFRLCYGWMPTACIPTAVARLQSVLQGSS